MADEITDSANSLAQAVDADVLLINAGMDRGIESQIIDKFTKRARRKNAVVLIVTSGGDADVA